MQRVVRGPKRVARFAVSYDETSRTSRLATRSQKRASGYLERVLLGALGNQTDRLTGTKVKTDVALSWWRSPQHDYIEYITTAQNIARYQTIERLGGCLSINHGIRWTCQPLTLRIQAVLSHRSHHRRLHRTNPLRTAQRPPFPAPSRCRPCP